MSLQQEKFRHYRTRSTVVFLLIPISCIAHIVCGFFFGNHQQWPVAELVVIAASLIALLRMFISARPLRGRLFILNSAGWLIAAGFVWWTQVYSSYPVMTVTVNPGESIVSFSKRGEPDRVDKPDPGPVAPAIPAAPVAAKDPVQIKLSDVPEEEIFLDANGKPFQLSRPPAPVKKKETTSNPPAANPIKEPQRVSFSNQSSATLLVFYRGWW